MPGKLVKQASLSTASSDTAQRIKVLTDYGSQVEIDKTLAVKLYFRSGKEMLRMANMYCDEDQLESAFILYYKFITLFVEKLPTHPDYKSSPPESVLDYKRKVKKVFPIAEEIKKKLKQRYVEEEELYLEEQKRLATERQLEEERRRKEREEQERKDAEMARRIQEEENAQVRESLEEQYRKMQLEEKEKMKREEEEKNKKGNQSAMGIAIGVAGAGTSFVLPGVPTDLNSIPESPGSASAVLPPPPSYLQYLTDISEQRPDIPDRSLKKNIVDGSVQPAVLPEEANSHAATMPVVDRSTKPGIDHHMSLGGFGDQAGGLRTVVVPSTLMDRFLEAAKSNTLREAETMGILCGKLTRGVFKITHLFIPKQTGGHDSCDMENEEELIFYQDEFNLITLGWIHTHPTQTAFLSSVDLHSHFPWQKMMPEAIAIVCSPKFNESGIFKLTDRGLDVIGSCRQSGFHPHAKDPPLFETCFHAQISDSDSIHVEDKRR